MRKHKPTIGNDSEIIAIDENGSPVASSGPPVVKKRVSFSAGITTVTIVPGISCKWRGKEKKDKFLGKHLMSCTKLKSTPKCLMEFHLLYYVYYIHHDDLTMMEPVFPTRFSQQVYEWWIKSTQFWNSNDETISELCQLYSPLIYLLRCSCLKNVIILGLVWYQAHKIVTEGDIKYYAFKSTI